MISEACSIAKRTRDPLAGCSPPTIVRLTRVMRRREIGDRMPPLRRV
jgi:hypothetical protein